MGVVPSSPITGRQVYNAEIMCTHARNCCGIECAYEVHHMDNRPKWPSITVRCPAQTSEAGHRTENEMDATFGAPGLTTNGATTLRSFCLCTPPSQEKQLCGSIPTMVRGRPPQDIPGIGLQTSQDSKEFRRLQGVGLSMHSLPMLMFCVHELRGIHHGLFVQEMLNKHKLCCCCQASLQLAFSSVRV